MGKLATLIAIITCGLTAHVHAQDLLAYWNMDADSSISAKFTANNGNQAGSVTMAAEPNEHIFDYLSNTTGTTENIYPEGTDTPSNNALQFNSIIDLGESGRLEMSGFNFSNMTDVTISFAAIADRTFTWNQEIHIDYKIGANSWVDWAESGAVDTQAWELESFVLPEAVEGQSNVAIRIRVSSWVTLASSLAFDNIQVTAVPEPGTWALLAGLGVLGLLIIRRRKRA